MICPYCLQGEVLNAIIKKTNESIQICDECDTIWTEAVSDQKGSNIDDFMQQRNCQPSWDELELV